MKYLTFATTWMDLEMITLCEMSQTEKVENHTIAPVCGVLNEKQQTGRTKKQRLRDMDYRLVGTRGDGEAGR